MVVTRQTEKGIMHYSDRNLKIRQVETGTIYDSADDIYPCPYTYEETDEPTADLFLESSDSDIAMAVRGVLNDE